MRSFQQVVVFLFALLACAFAQDTEVYDATVYITSTVYRVNTIYQSGTPTGPVVNQTSTISAVIPTYPAANTTAVAPTASHAKPSPSQFTGAASALNANALVAAFAAGVGYLVL